MMRISVQERDGLRKSSWCRESEVIGASVRVHEGPAFSSAQTYRRRHIKEIDEMSSRRGHPTHNRAPCLHFALTILRKLVIVMNNGILFYVIYSKCHQELKIKLEIKNILLYEKLGQYKENFLKLIRYEF